MTTRIDDGRREAFAGFLDIAEDWAVDFAGQAQEVEMRICDV
jgi:hypothetical protein